jgi:FO synthase
MTGPFDVPLDDRLALDLSDAGHTQLRDLMQAAAQRRSRAWGRTLTFSPKVFLPLTNLCRNDCDYCAFRRSAGDQDARTMAPSAVDRTLLDASRHGCVEALFCLGDRPETAFPSYRSQLAGFGFADTTSYLCSAGRLALSKGLLPHTNAGVLGREEMARLREVNVSLGLMLENVSDRLCQRGGPHHRAPDKRPARRLSMLEQAGELAIPFTTGILVGIGETPRERVEALLAIRQVHRRYGHVQEVIVQNFTPHAGTPMEHAAEPLDEDIALAVAMARLILDDEVSVQSPPNLNPTRTRLLIESGINDFGGISPVTPDFINPDRPWPRIRALAREAEACGFSLRPRLPIYEAFVDRGGFLDPRLRPSVNAARERMARFDADPSRPASFATEAR